MFKRIDAYIRPEKTHAVKGALQNAGIYGMSFTEVKGHGRQGGTKLVGRSGPYMIDMLERIQLTIVVSAHNVDETVTLIQESAATGETGDGVIFISPVEDVVRIRTGERGAKAMTYSGDIDDRRQK